MESDVFYDDPEIQERYEKRIHIIIDEVKRLYGSSVKLDVHLPMVRELARTEIACRRYEKMIANDREGETTASLLRSERQQMNKLREQLGLSMDKIEKSSSDRGQSEADNITDFVVGMMSDMDDNELTELKKEIKEDD